MNIDLSTKIAEYDQNVADLRAQLNHAQESGKEDDVRIFTDRLHDVAYARYALKSLYIESICKEFNIDISTLIEQVGSHIDVSKLQSEYDVLVTAKLKT